MDGIFIVVDEDVVLFVSPEMFGLEGRRDLVVGSGKRNYQNNVGECDLRPVNWQ